MNKISIPNYDATAGVYYGVISQHTVSPEALDDFYMLSDNVSLEQAREEFAEDLRAFFKKHGIYNEQVQEQVQEILGEEFAEHLEGSADDTYWYGRDGYVLETCLTRDLMVICSPWVTWSPPCSPCVPGAGNLDDAASLIKPYLNTDYPHDQAIERMMYMQNSQGAARVTYCLGPEWFDDEQAPYPYAPVGSWQDASTWIFPDTNEDAKEK